MDVLRAAVTDISAFRWQALAWALAQQTYAEGFVAFLTNNRIEYPNDPFPNRLFVGAKRVIPFSGENTAGTDAFEIVYKAHSERPSFLVGYWGYDLKNQLEALASCHPNRLGFPEAYFVEPEWVIDFENSTVSESNVVIRGDGDANELLNQLLTYPQPNAPRPRPPAQRNIQCRVTPETYQDTVRRTQEHILAGDVYELNYCIEFFSEKATLDPLAMYRALTERSPMPFSSFLKIGDKYVMGASPERFLKKEGQKILSQPIKGTVRRGITPDEDVLLRDQLLNSEKERAENLMIVDLVRNDLARSAVTGSVQVDELFGIYGFQQVYQMISTVSATLRENVTWAEAIRNAFPMGSMTGAPKIRAMELIDELEVSRRGVYSGAIGFITPDGDFDFNVVIRTLLYDAQRQYASFSVGSAITYDADPAQEWEECLLKARAIREVLENSH
ncbi:aminodeoxychorismate synthase component I [Spirosoma endophyticum]|uniref:aminodeoxychorismate synthase n=1 Tax=Spirosoma endophyticum TaxID=662367 RepID=A0A1I1RKJ3_9BACT|nr:aminodeoxychorismate synthase component I [Spirosoma endophyticum]SFD34557.1 para-aminobenzoate synthetase component 1 [Spirosoma endophyticum]